MVAYKDVGHLRVLLTMDASQFKAQLASIAKATQQFVKAANYVQQPTRNIRAFIKANSLAAQALQEQLPAGYRAVEMYKMLKDGSLTGALGVVKANETMLKSVLSLKSFFAKTVHYITFSIGVQMVMAIRRGLEESITAFADFEKAIVNAATVSGYLGSQFKTVVEHLSSLARVLSTKTLYSVQEIAQSFYNLASAGIDVSKITAKQFLPILQYAQATQSDLYDATYAVLSVMKQFGLSMDDTRTIVDAFTKAITSSFATMEKLKEAFKYAGPLAGSLGMEFRELEAAMVALMDAGYTGAQAGQRLNMILTKLLKPTDKAKRTLTSLGISMEDINPSANKLSDILLRLKAAGFSAADATEMFRARTAGAAAYLVKHADLVARLELEYKTTTGITEDVAKAQEDTLAGAIKKLSNEMGRLSITIGSVLGPALFELLSFIRNVTSGLSNLFKPFGGFIKATALLSAALKTLVVVLSALAIKKIIVATYTKILVKMIIREANAMTQAEVATAAETAALEANAVASANAAAAKAGLASSTSALISGSGLLTTILSKLNIILLIAGTAFFAYQYYLDSTTESSDKLTEAQKKLLETLTPLEQKLYKTKDLSKVVDILQEQAKAYSDVYVKLKKTGMTFQEYIAIFAKYNAEQGASNKEIQKGIQALEDQKRAFDILMEAAKDAGVDTTKVYEELSASGLASFFSDIKKVIPSDKLNDFYTALANLVGPIQSSTYATIYLSDSLKDFYRAVVDSKSAAELYNRALKDMENAAIPTAEAEVKLWQAQNRLEQSNINVIRSANLVIKGLKQFPNNLEKIISLEEKVARAQYNLEITQRDLEVAQHEVTIATQDLTDAMIEFGTASDEYFRAQQRLNAAIKDQVDIQSKLGDLQSTIAEGSNIIRKALSGEVVTLEDARNATVQYSEGEIEILKLSQQIINLREEYLTQLSEEEYWKSILASLEKFRANGLKYLTKQLKSFWKLEDKLYDLEYKLYKLRQDEDDQLDELFDTLAQQGLITSDIIDSYKDLKKSQGNLLKLNYSFINALSDLTPAQREVVEEFFNAEEGTQEYYDALDKVMNLPGASIFIEMRNAQQDLFSSTSSLSDALLPLVQSLLNMGLISSDTAKQFYDFIDNVYEVASAESDLEDTQNQLLDNFDSVARIITQVANSLVSGSDDASSYADIWNELTDTLGISSISVDELRNLLGLTGSEFDSQYQSISDFNDEQLILAATMKYLYDKLGLYEDGMNAVYIANQLGIIATDDFNEGIQILISHISTAGEDLYTYAEAMNNLNNATSLVNSTFQTLIDTVDKLAGKLDQIRLDEYIKNLRKELGGNIYKFFSKFLEFPTGFGARLAFGRNLQAMLPTLETMFPDFAWEDLANKLLSTQNNITQVTNSFQSAVSTISSSSSTASTSISTFFGELLNSVTSSVSTASDSVSTFFSDLIEQITSNPVPPITIEVQYKQTGTPPTGGGRGGGGRHAGGGRTRSRTSRTLENVADAIDNLGGDSTPIRRIADLLPFQRGGIVNKPTFGVFGEAGSEAIIPLEKNKKYGEKLLVTVLKRYYPDLLFQRGGIFTKNEPIIITESPSTSETFSINGPIIVQNVSNVDDFMEQLKFKARAAGARK